MIRSNSPKFVMVIPLLCYKVNTQKVKTLSRDPADYVAVRKGDQAPMPRNLDPALHPFERAREYTRALNATKLNRMYTHVLLVGS